MPIVAARAKVLLGIAFLVSGLWTLTLLDAAGKRDGTGVVKLLTDYVSRYREFKTLSGPLSSTAQ